MKKFALIMFALVLTGCDLDKPKTPPSMALTEDGHTIYAALPEFIPIQEFCLDSFVALTNNHRSWWKLDQETRMPIRCKVIK